jgi:hypothetical protein
MKVGVPRGNDWLGENRHIVVGFGDLASVFPSGGYRVFDSTYIPAVGFIAALGTIFQVLEERLGMHKPTH